MIRNEGGGRSEWLLFSQRWRIVESQLAVECCARVKVNVTTRSATPLIQSAYASDWWRANLCLVAIENGKYPRAP
jgi:hypothetical protein